MRENTALCYRVRIFLICYIKILLACLLACLLIMEEASAMSSTLCNFVIIYSVILTQYLIFRQTKNA